MTRKNDSLPHSDEAEKALIGAFIHSPDTVYEKCLFRGVTSKWFYHPLHGAIFNGICEMRVDGKFLCQKQQKAQHIDYLIPITQYLSDHAERLGVCSGNISSDATSCYTSIPTASNVDYYIDRLQQKAAQRLGIIEAQGLVLKLKQCTELTDISNLLTGAFTEAKELCCEKEKKDHDRELLMKFVDKIEALNRGDIKPEFFPFGIPDLDAEVGGAMRGEMIVIHGETSAGKSLLSQHILQLNCVYHEKKGEVFSMEMPSDQYYRRLTASLGNIHLNSIKSGRFSKQEFKSFTEMLPLLDNANIGIHDMTRNKMSLPSIEGAIRKVKKNKGCDMVVVDYLQLMDIPKGKSESRRDQDLNSVSKKFKRLALELDLIIILVAQAAQDGKVHDSKQVESDADWVFGMIPVTETVGKITRITGTNGVWLSKAREGQRGLRFGLKMHGQYARLEFGYFPEEPKSKKLFSR